MILNLATTLGINLPILGKKNPLTTLSKLYRKSQIPVVQLDRIVRLDPQVPLIQTSRPLATNSPDRLHYGTKQSDIGWDNWQPINRSSNRDDFDYKVDRSRYDLIDRPSHTDGLKHPALDFFTTVLPTEFAEIDPHLDDLSTYSAEVEIPTPVKRDRSIANDIQP